MQDKNLFNDKENKDAENVQNNNATDNTADDGVVYVANADGTEFDASERTYVAVEGLEGEIGSENSTGEDNAEEKEG